jgi:hypothetical protein
MKLKTSSTEISRHLSKDNVSREAVVIKHLDGTYGIIFYANNKYVYSQSFTSYNVNQVENAAEDYAINGNVYGSRENHLFKSDLQ